MMKPHCDRCEKLIDGGFKTWLDDGGIWHVYINEGKGSMFCLDCYHFILISLAMELKPIPTAGPAEAAIAESFAQNKPEEEYLHRWNETAPVVVESHIPVPDPLDDIPF